MSNKISWKKNVREIDLQRDSFHRNKKITWATYSNSTIFLSTITRTQWIINRVKKTYFKLNEFYDAHENWKKWKNHFKTKIKIDNFMFLNEQHKIKYVKKHTRKTIYDIVKHRVVANNENSYQTLKKLILNLKQIFEKKKQNVQNDWWIIQFKFSHELK